MQFWVGVQFENVTAGVRFCWELALPVVAVIR